MKRFIKWVTAPKDWTLDDWAQWLGGLSIISIIISAFILIWTDSYDVVTSKIFMSSVLCCFFCVIAVK